jgi:hypothetical protein
MPFPTDAGNEDIRSYIQSTWTYISLRNPDGDEITRIDVETDDRAEWTKDSTNNPIEATITVRGDNDDVIDPDNPSPTTIASTESYRTADGITTLSDDTVVDVTLEALDDEVVVTHRIEYPKQN